MSTEPTIQTGFVEPAVAAAHPGLGLAWCAFTARRDPSRRSSPALRKRLRRLSDRVRGADAIALRGRPVVHAYRVLFRTLGVEPDIHRVPAEAYVLERLQRGGFPSRGVLADALLIACVETAVGVYAVAGPRAALGLVSADGQVVVADADGPITRAFDAPAFAGGRDVALYAIVAPGVPAVAVHEALWTAWDVVENG